MQRILVYNQGLLPAGKASTETELKPTLIMPPQLIYNNKIRMPVRKNHIIVITNEKKNIINGDETLLFPPEERPPILWIENPRSASSKETS